MKLIKSLNFLTVLCLFSSLLAVVGCGSGGSSGPIVKWSGTVTVAGKPIPTDLVEAFILVRPANPDQHGLAGPTQGEVKPDGTYQLKDVPKGKVVVQFRLMQKTGKMATDPVTKEKTDKLASIVPKDKVNGIEIDATKDDKQMNFDL